MEDIVLEKPLFQGLIVAIVLVLGGGCSGSDTPTTQAATAPTTTVTSVEASGGENTDSPIEALLGVPVFDEDAMNDWFNTLDIERRRLTAECMLAEGFEYSPEVPTTIGLLVTDLSRSSREYAETFGFGVVATFEASEYDPDKDYSTTNSAYIASLTEAELEAYYLALQGPPNESGESFDDDVFFGSDGCEGSAFEEVFAVVGVMDELGPVADEYFQQIQADSRMIALVDSWSLCMAEAGYTYSDPDAVRESFFEQLDALTFNDAAYQNVPIPDDLPQPEFVFSGDSFGVHPKLTNEAQTDLDALFEDEVDTATANWDCREPLLDDELAIQREYESAFVAEVGPGVATALDGG